MTSDWKTTNLNETTPLVVGRLYRISFTDCCIEGHFKAHYLGHDDGGLLFDTASIGPNWNSVRYQELDG